MKLNKISKFEVGACLGLVELLSSKMSRNLPKEKGTHKEVRKDKTPQKIRSSHALVPKVAINKRLISEFYSSVFRMN